MKSPRTFVWLQILLGWMPVWALYVAMLLLVHRDGPATKAAYIAARQLLPALFLGLLVHRLARRVPWPRPFRVRFAFLHLVAAAAFSLAWITAVVIVESAIAGGLVIAMGPGPTAFFVFGFWLYVMVAGISYGIETTERAALAETNAARTQLAALRAQLHPHFLFNALHTVVQLIPVDPARAQEAAEQLAGLLRTATEEDRDIVSLGDEWAFVSQYLELERIRFGDRLRVHTTIDKGAMDAPVPSFALQTLVENAVRHGAAPRVEPTDIFVDARSTSSAMTLSVRDTGEGAASSTPNGNGTGLARLRERLAVLYGGAAALDLTTSPGAGWSATLTVPRPERK